MNWKLTFLLLILVNSVASAQIRNLQNYEIGYYRDINNQLIDGYFDINHKQGQSINVSYNIEANYVPGHYFDLKNHKISGLIKYSRSNSFFRFKKNINDAEITIHPINCKSFVVSADTFTVLKFFEANRDIYGTKIVDSDFVEIIDRFNNFTFYKHIRIIGVRTDEPVITYIVKVDSTNNLITIVNNENKFKESANKIFRKFELLKSRISSGRYNYRDIPLMIKFLKYKLKYDHNEKIYFNSAWNEIDNINKSAYYAKIKSIYDSLFHISYYLSDGTPIYEGDYYSFLPSRNTGKFVWYYPNGKIRKTTTYVNNEPTKTITYFRNGNIHSKYTVEKGNCLFENIYTTYGKEVLNNSGEGIETLYDSLTNREITNKYITNKLVNSFYTDSINRKIFQVCSNTAKLKIKIKLKNTINKLTIPDNLLINDIQGVLLFKCIVEPSGATAQFELIKGIDSTYDSLVCNALSFVKKGKTWEPAKMDNENVVQEIIIPITFSLIGHNREGSHKNSTYNWMDNQMFNNQQHKIPNEFKNRPIPRNTLMN